MVCISSAPTVDLVLSVPVPMERGGWAWGEHPRFPGSLAAEYAYDGRECCNLVRAYAVTISRLPRPAEALRFSVYARGRVTGMITARDEWSWCPETRSYLATSEQPWDTSRAALRRYFELTGVQLTKQRFRARIGDTSPRMGQARPKLRLVPDLPQPPIAA